MPGGYHYADASAHVVPVNKIPWGDNAEKAVVRSFYRDNGYGFAKCVADESRIPSPLRV